MKTTNVWAKWWATRDIDWSQAYTSLWNHPHRELIVNRLKEIRWFSLLEVGCASGPNLIRIRREFPNKELGGIDVNDEAIRDVKRNDRRWIMILNKDKGVMLNDEEANLMLSCFPEKKPTIKELSKPWFVETRDVQKSGIFLSDKGVDVILSDMTLIYIGPFKIKKVLKQIARVARFDVIFVEFHSESWWQRFKLWWQRGYFAHNYKQLLEKCGFYDIILTKLEEKDWPGGEPQKSFAYLITAKR